MRSRGPRAKPALPPTEKMLIPVARFSPATRLAKRVASGWNAATPSPLRTTAIKVSG